MSKAYGLAGLRIGWVATRNTELLTGLAAFKDYTTICSSAPSEFLAALALRHTDAIVGRNLEIIRQNLDLLDQFFAAHEEMFAWYRPRTGPIAFPELRHGAVDAFCTELVERAGVLLLPGTLYEAGSRSFRVGFGRRNVPEALQRLDDFIRGLR
jgi:aspartate/methionine/tyrosine aminotransferase